MAYDPTEIAALRARLGWAEPEDEGGLWDTITQPIKGALGVDANVGGQILGLLVPDAYEEAAKALQEDLSVDSASSIMERAEALPGFGDVGAELIPDEIRESWVGTALGPIARMGGNILGSPTTYTPWILGKAGQAVIKGIPAAERLARATVAGTQTPQMISAATEALAQAGKMKQAGAWMGRHAVGIDKAMALGGMAYAPELVAGVGQSASESWRLAMEGEYGDAVATGVGGAFLAGLGALMAKGVIDAAQATKNLRGWLSENHPNLVKARDAAADGELASPTMDEVARDADPIEIVGETEVPTGADMLAPEDANVPSQAAGGTETTSGAPEVGTTPQDAPTSPTGASDPIAIAQAAYDKSQGKRHHKKANATRALLRAGLSGDEARAVTAQVDAKANGETISDTVPPKDDVSDIDPTRPEDQLVDGEDLMDEPSRVPEEEVGEFTDKDLTDEEAAAIIEARQAQEEADGFVTNPDPEVVAKEMVTTEAPQTRINEGEPEVKLKDGGEPPAPPTPPSRGGGETPKASPSGRRRYVGDEKYGEEKMAEYEKTQEMENEYQRITEEERVKPGQQPAQRRKIQQLEQELQTREDIPDDAFEFLPEPKGFQEKPGIKTPPAAKLETTGEVPYTITLAAKRDANGKIIRAARKVEIPGEMVPATWRQKANEGTGRLGEVLDAPEIEGHLVKASEVARRLPAKAQKKMAAGVRYLIMKHGNDLDNLTLALRTFNESSQKLRQMYLRRAPIMEMDPKALDAHFEAAVEYAKLADDPEIAVIRKKRKPPAEGETREALTLAEEAKWKEYETLKKRVGRAEAPVFEEVYGLMKDLGTDLTGVKKLLKSLEAGDSKIFKPLTDAANAKVERRAKRKELEFEPDVEEKLTKAYTRAMKGANQWSEDGIQRVMPKVMRELAANAEIEYNGKMINIQDLSWEELAGLISARGFKRGKDVKKATKKKDELSSEQKDKSGKTVDVLDTTPTGQITPDLALMAKEAGLTREGEVVATGRPNAETIANLPEGRLKGGTGKNSWSVERAQVERYDEGVAAGLSGHELKEFVFNRTMTKTEQRNKFGKIKKIWTDHIKGEAPPKFAGEWDAKAARFLDEHDLKDVKLDREVRDQLNSMYKSYLTSRAKNEITAGRGGPTMPGVARMREALIAAGVEGLDAKSSRVRVMEALADFLDPTETLKKELIGVAGTVVKAAKKSADVASKLGELEGAPRKSKATGKTHTRFLSKSKEERIYFDAEDGGRIAYLADVDGDAKIGLEEFVLTQREKGLRELRIGEGEWTPARQEAMTNLRNLGLVERPDYEFVPGPNNAPNRNTRIYKVKAPGKLASSTVQPKLDRFEYRGKKIGQKLDRTLMGNGHLVEQIADTLGRTFDKLVGGKVRSRSVIEDAKAVLLAQLEQMKRGRSIFHGRRVVQELSAEQVTRQGLASLGSDVLSAKGVVKVKDRYFQHDPVRTLIRTEYMHKDSNAIFEDFDGVARALEKARQAAGVGGLEPRLLYHGGFNAVWGIGKDPKTGQGYALKISTADDNLRFAEDAVPELGEIMAPVIRSGITPEGFTWRVEPLGTPAAVLDVDGGIYYPTDLSPKHIEAIKDADATVKQLEAEGKILLTKDYGQHQYAIINGRPMIVDRGVIIPRRQARSIDRYLAQHVVATKNFDEMTPRERFVQETQYEEAIARGEALEGGGVVAEFDVSYGTEISKRYAGALGRKGADTLRKIVAKVNQITGAKVRFGGVTMSPYLRGQYVNGRVFVNFMEELHATGDVDKAARSTIMNIQHEVLHDIMDDAAAGMGVHGHSSAFDNAMGDLMVKMEDETEKWVRELSDAVDHDELSALMPHYKEASLNGGIGRESWRRPEGVEGVPPRSPEGSTTRAQDQRGAGEAGTEADRGAGIQRGRTVPGGVEGEATGMGYPASSRRGDRGAADSSVFVVEGDRAEGGRLASRKAGPTTIEEGTRLIRELTDTKGVRAEDAAREAVTVAFQIARRTQEIEPDAFKEMVAKPSPSRMKGEVWSRFNLETTEGLSDLTKGAIKIWSDITRANPKLSKMFEADTVRGWDELDTEVTKLLGANSEADLIKMLGKRKGLTDTEVHLARMIGTDLSFRVQEAERDLMAAQLGRAQGKLSAEKLADAMGRYTAAVDNFAVNMGKVLNPVTGVGRALAAARKTARSLDPHQAMWQDMRAGLYERLRARYKDTFELDQVVDHLMGSAAEGFNKGDLSGFADDFRKAMRFTLPDKLLEAYKAGLLGWKSRAANITSNTLVQGVREVERNVANMMENVVAKIKGEEPESYMGEVKLNSMVMKHWASTAIPEYARATKDAFMLKPEDYGNLLKFGTLAEDFNIVVGAIPGKFGEFMRFTLKGMNAEDAIFKKMTQLQYYYRQTYRNVQKGKRGFHLKAGEDAIQATARIVKELEQFAVDVEAGKAISDETAKKFGGMRTEGIRLAREDTFQKELPNWLKGLVQAMGSGHGKWAQLIFPFVRTPWNIAVETVKRTPLGFLDVAKKWDGMTRMERMDALSRPAVGTAIGAAVFMASMEDVITGGGPVDPEAEANKKTTGWMPYSIKLGGGKFGGAGASASWHSYQRMEPMSSIMGMAADLAEGVKEGDFSEGQFRTGMVRLVGSITENLTNKTFLSGLEGLVTALSDPIRYGERWIKQQQGAWIPNTIGPIPFGHLAQAMDDTYRQTDAFTASPFIAKVPGLSKTLEPQLTPTGEERKRPGAAWQRLASPVISSNERKDFVSTAAQLLDEIGSPPSAPKRYTYVKGVRVWFTPEERQVLAKQQQAATKFIGARLAKDPNFLRLPDNEDVAPLGAKTKKDVVKSIFDKFRKAGMAQVNPRLMRRAAKHEGGEVRN